MKAGFDCAIYYYRNCADLEAFRNFHVELPNLREFAAQVVVLPTYPSLPLAYTEKLALAVIAAVRHESATLPLAEVLASAE
jgi:hypothetical protein